MKKMKQIKEWIRKRIKDRDVIAGKQNDAFRKYDVMYQKLDVLWYGVMSLGLIGTFVFVGLKIGTDLAIYGDIALVIFSLWIVVTVAWVVWFSMRYLNYLAHGTRK